MRLKITCHRSVQQPSAEQVAERCPGACFAEPKHPGAAEGASGVLPLHLNSVSSATRAGSHFTRRPELPSCQIPDPQREQLGVAECGSLQTRPQPRASRSPR